MALRTNPTFRDPGWRVGSIALTLLQLVGCGPSPSVPSSVAIRLVDRYDPSLLQRAAGPPVAPPPRTEWRFDAPPAAGASRWRAGPGVTGLGVRSGRLVGLSTTEIPILHLERKTGLGDPDLLHAVEIRILSSAGANLSANFLGSEKVNFRDVLSEVKDFPWLTRTPLIAGTTMRAYTLRPQRPVPSSRIRHVLIRPTDARDATFEIESIRLVFRKEFLAGVPSGVSWQGLSDVYHETMVSRSPETIRTRVRLPEKPWLDLSLGTLEDQPVTFRVGIRAIARARPEPAETVVLERTLTRSHRWETAPVDLLAYAGREAILTFSLRSEKDGTLGLWGSPAVRSRGAMPPETSPGPEGFARPRGIILIWVDTLRRDHLDVYGYERSTAPNIRRMAAEGTLFRDCLVQATWTKVSTPSLLTSLYPSAHGVREFSDRLPASVTTLAEVFREAGYATLSMSSILFTGQFTNLHQGFEEVHEDGSLPDQESSKTAREYVDRLGPWLETHREVPFFILLHVSDPHDPYRPYPPYDTLWVDPSRAEEHERQAKEVRRFIADPLLKRFGMPDRSELVRAGFDPEAYVAVDRDWYDGSIRGMDAEVGRLLERLRHLGIDRETLVVLTGDHGEEFLEHGRMFHGQTTYGELTNVPLIFWGPGSIPQNTVVEPTVEIIDLMPTLLQLARLPPPGGMQGRSLVPLLAGATRGPWQDRPAVTEKLVTQQSAGAPPPRDTESHSIVRDGWKLIHNTRRPEGQPEFELYDTRQDPLNRKDLAPSQPHRVERLSAQLARWRSKVKAERAKPEQDDQKLRPEDLERLRSLGYIQ